MGKTFSEIMNSPEYNEAIKMLGISSRISGEPVKEDIASLNKYIYCLSHGIVPNDCTFVRNFSMYGFRRLIVSEFGFPTYSKLWMDELVNYLRGKKVLEVMAGTGLISKYLRKNNILTHTTDNYSWEFGNKYTEIEEMDAVKSIEKYGKSVDYIIMSWPDYNKSYANDVLLKIREVNPNCKIIYLGEMCGCTADDAFHNNANFIEDDEAFNKISDHYIEWDGLHDNLYLVN